MAVYTYSAEGVSKVSAHRLFKAMAVHRHEVIQKLKPHIFKSHEFIQGDGDAGSIIKIHFVEGHPLNSFVIRINELDVEKFHCKNTIIEGGVLHDYLEKIEHIIDYEVMGAECKGKVTVNHYPKPGCSVNEEAAKISEERAKEMFSLVEKYLLDNPDVYA